MLPAEQADTVHCPAAYSAKRAADIAEDSPAEYSADTAEGSLAEHSVRTAEHSVHTAVRTAEDNPAEHSVRTAVRTADGSPAEHSADRKADKGCTEALPQVRLRLL